VEEILATLALTLGASFCAGINLYATLFVLGAMSRFTGFDLPVDLLVLESHWVLWPALTLYCVEFFADKVPALDSAWDSIQTFLRIPAGVVIAATALGEVPLELQICSGMVGGTLATMAHGTKATVRLAAHGTGTSPAVSPVASLAEDALVITTMAFVATNPVISLILFVIMLVAAAFILWACWNLAKTAFRGIAKLFGLGTDPEPPPAAA